MDASFAGRADMISLLLDAGADPNVVSASSSRHTPLTRVCQYHKTIPKHEGHVESLRVLLRRGADASLAAGPLDMRPICYAAMGPLRSLIEVIQGDRSSFDVFDAAVLCDCSQLEEHAEEIDEKLVDHASRTPLHYVAMSGLWKESGIEDSIASTELLLREGVDLRAVQPIPDGGTIFNADALWWCVAYQNNIELARFLLARGASPDSSVYTASFEGDEAMCELLEQYGANWNQRLEGKTPLMDVLTWNRTKSVPWLIEHGADPSIVDDRGRNSLHYAASRGVNNSTLGRLIDAGVDPSAVDRDGKNAMDLAIAKKRKKSIEYLSMHD